jgi:predicted nuclease of restriction endonuclease-like (RecB) superfamily
MAKGKTKIQALKLDNYAVLVGDINGLFESARKASVRSINAVLTTAYWLIGRRIVEYEYQGMDRTEYYGNKLLVNLSIDLQKKFGRGFSRQNIQLMKQFYEAYPQEKISQTPSGKSSVSDNISQTPSNLSLSNISQTPFRNLDLNLLVDSFPLSWSHYVMLVSRVKDEQARIFYGSEALSSGWSVRQLDRQISSQFYERTLLSKNKLAMLKEGEKPLPADIVTPEEEIKDPYVLEFLGLKDEYSESDLEEALIKHLEKFLLELGSDFAFIGRQKRLRIGGEWYRVDLLFFHRTLRCLVVIDLKVGKFTHADAGQMHLYLNYAKEHWTNKNENPPVGLILCAEKDSAVARYALEGLPNKILAAEYKLALPNEKLLQSELNKTQKLLYKRFKKNG